MRVLITQQAKNALDEIIEYYRSVGNGKYGRRVRAAILRKALLLSKFPLMGAEEELLKELNLGHRYLVEKEYKVIYRIEDTFIYITDIFDTRRNPEDIKP
jgi:plasmid stabilization system protein ParE